MKNNNTSLKLTSFNSSFDKVVAYGNNAAFSRPPGVPLGRLTDLRSGKASIEKREIKDFFIKKVYKKMKKKFIKK